VAFLVLAAAAAAFFLLPLLGLITRTPWASAWSELQSAQTLEALRLSLVCSLGATAAGLLLGVPLAWVNARLRFPGRDLLRALTTLPMVLPPVVGGVALLLAFGRRGLAGQWLAQAFGIQLPFTTAGAIMAEAFVSMPFLVITVEAGLRSMDLRYEEAARTLGAGRWLVLRRVTLPLVAPSIVAGAVLCWARALGEFGAVYVELETRPDAAIVLSLLLLLVSLAVLVALRKRWLGSA
jgi:molybdate transport system permease protein